MIDFAFLVHPRNIKDVISNIPFLRFVPSSFLKFAVNRIDYLYISNVYVKVNNKETHGIIIVLTKTPGFILENREKVSKVVVKAVKTARKKGARIVGLGAFTSPITHGGLDIAQKYSINVTNGNAYTSYIVVQGINDFINYVGADYRKLTISIIGATGSIGSAVSKILASKFKKSILIGRSREKIDKLKKDLYGSNIYYSTDIYDIKKSDIIILATSSQDVLLTPEKVKTGCVIYDITHPSNISYELFKDRKDVLVLEGGLAKVPNMEVGINLGLPSGVYFACLCETVLLALEKRFEDFSVGYVDIDKVKEISKIADKYGFKPANFISFGVELDKDYVNSFWKKAHN